MSDPTWFTTARFGCFIHFGPYAAIGRGEQVLFREHLDQADYQRAACAWNPRYADPAEWMATIRAGGFRYVVLTARHHDGYCLWDTRTTDYSSAQQAPQRDLIRAYVDAARAAGLRVGLYYSWADWRIPAYWDGPTHDPAGWTRFQNAVATQLEELCTHYGQIDLLWFDGSWPHVAEDWDSPALLERIRAWQPGILVNNRLGALREEIRASGHADGGLGAGESRVLGDFSTPEQHVAADRKRPWESCQTSIWRLWGHTRGGRWKTTDALLDQLIECASKGGNLLLNVGPDGDGRLPAPFIASTQAIGAWLQRHGSAIFGPGAGDVCEFVTRGWQTVRGNDLHLVIRFWDGRPTLRLAGLASRVTAATLLSTGSDLRFTHDGDVVTVYDLPEDQPDPLFAVIRLRCVEPPRCAPLFAERLWSGDARRMQAWAAARGPGMQVDGRW